MIYYHGDKPQKSQLEVNTPSKEDFQLWHLEQFNNAIKLSYDLIYQYEDVFFSEKCVKPFIHLSDKYYCLEIDTKFYTPNHQLMILPHYSYYVEEDVPLPVCCSWETDWWKFPLTIYFKYTNLVKFHKNKPFAHIMAANKSELSYMENIVDENKYVARKWFTPDGIMQDNLYNVLHFKRKEC